MYELVSNAQHVSFVVQPLSRFEIAGIGASNWTAGTGGIIITVGSAITFESCRADARTEQACHPIDDVQLRMRVAAIGLGIGCKQVVAQSGSRRNIGFKIPYLEIFFGTN